MTFTLFGIDWYWTEKIFGIWILSIKTETYQGALFCIYHDGTEELFIEILWFRVHLLWCCKNL